MNAIFLLISAQNIKDVQLAHQFFQDKEYSKALELYKDAHKANQDPYIYKNIVHCYIQLQEYKAADKWLRKELKRSNSPTTIYIDLFHIENLLENLKQAEIDYKAAKRSLIMEQYAFHNMASRLQGYGYYDKSIEIFQFGQQELQNKSLFLNELANLSIQAGKKDQAIKFFVEHCYLNEVSKEQAIGWFTLNTKAIEEKQKLKVLLFKTIQKDPNALFTQELLIWVMIELNEEKEAIEQAKIVDGRSGLGGKVLLDFAEVMQEKKKYSLAIEAVNHVRIKGNTYYSFLAEKKLLELKKEAITSHLPIDTTKVISLMSNYNDFIMRRGVNNKTAETIKDKAYMLSFYLGKYAEAQDLLVELISKTSVERKFKGEAKILLADIQLLARQIWDAQLTYWQVEKAFKESTIGHEAKYKVALLSYYIGDFEWAQNQLDALKGSTSKLISNDAIKLSTFITENIGIDSFEIPLKLYAQGQLALFQMNFESAFLKFDTLETTFTDHILLDDLWMEKASWYLKVGDLKKAELYLEKIIAFEKEQLLKDEAIFTLAEILYNDNIRQSEASALYEKIIQNHPSSIFVTEARKKFRMLRGDKIN